MDRSLPSTRRRTPAIVYGVLHTPRPTGGSDGRRAGGAGRDDDEVEGVVGTETVDTGTPNVSGEV